MSQKVNHAPLVAGKISLNKEQEEAADHIHGPCFICACPGSGKCITGDSLVLLSDGFKEIGNLSTDGFTEIQKSHTEHIRAFDKEALNGSNYGILNIAAFVDSGIKPTLKIETEAGFSIQGTYHHPIAILNERCNLEWKNIENVKAGDVAILQMEKAFDNPIKRHPAAYDSWYIMGLLLGDGYISRKNELHLTTNDDEIHAIFAKYAKENFDYDVCVYPDKRRKNLRTLSICSKRIKEILLTQFGDFEHLAQEKMLTSKMLIEYRGELGSLIQGLFDTDGYVSGGNVEICLSSKKLITQLQIILLRFGVFAVKRIKIVKGKEYYRLHISGESMRMFAKNIGFRLTRKSEQLAALVAKNHNANRTIPFIENLVTSIYEDLKKLKPYNYDGKKSHLTTENGKNVRLIRYTSLSKAVRRGVTQSAARDILSGCRLAGLDTEATRQLEFLINNFEFDSVKSVVDGGNQQVYDYQVDKYHNFIANGFVNHNTRVIIERTVRLIQKGFSPRSILCITFTNKAAQEMKKRIITSLGEVGNEIYISTFHALCATIIRKYGAYIGYGENTTILDDDGQEGLMAQASRQAGFEFTVPQIKSLIWKVNDLREKLIPEDDFEMHFKVEAEAAIVRDYIARMRKNRQIDFSGLLSETVHLLEKDSEILSKLQSRFDFIQVDETQDTNLAQFKIVQLIGAHNNVFVVGDPDQGIYSWRGARYQNIEDFVNINKAKVICLPENYRSTPEIIKAASVLIQKNENRKQKMDFRTSNPSGLPIECVSLQTPEQEAAYIAHRIKGLMDQGYKLHDFAVLYRINSMSRSIEQGLMAAGITYQIIGGFSFFDRSEVRDSLAMLKFMINPCDGMALSRFINKPARRLGEVALGKIENFANDKGINLLESMKRADEYMLSGADKTKGIQSCKDVVEAFNFDRKGLSIGEVLGKILHNLNYTTHLESKFEGKELDDKKDNLQELVNACALYSAKKGNDISSYLANIALQTSSDKETKEDSVSLLSLHSSKGLEFPVVFMPCMEEGQFPHKRAIAERDGLEEERRICYVGMTRAEKLLIMSYPNTRMQRYKNGGVQFEKTTKSRFLTESGVISSLKSLGNK